MNRNPDVDRWLDAYDNPMKPVVSAIRDLALACDPRITEAIFDVLAVERAVASRDSFGGTAPARVRAAAIAARERFL